MKKLKNNSLVRFVVALFLFGLAVGIVVYFSYKPNLNEYMDNFKSLIVTTPNNTFLLNFIIISSIFLLSLFVIGVPFIIFYIFYEGLSVGYTLSVFISFYGFKGALFYLLFFLVIKLVFVFLALLFSMLAINFSYKLIKSIIDKNKEKIYKLLIEHIFCFGEVLILCVINSLLIYLLSHRIISLFIGFIV